MLDLADLLDPLLRMLVARQRVEYVMRRFLLARVHQEARRLGHEEHADQEDDRGHGSQSQHEAPVTRRGEDRVHDEGREDARDDHQLVQRRDGAADLRGGDLGQVDRHGERRGSDRETQDEARSNQNADTG